MLTPTCYTLALGLLGCAPSIQNYAAPSQLAPDDAFTCAMRELATKNYTVVQSDRASGFIKAERKKSGGFTEALTGSSWYNDLTVSVVKPAEGAGSTVRVTAATSQQEGGQNRTTTNQSVSKEVQADADAIMAACK